MTITKGNKDEKKGNPELKSGTGIAMDCLSDDSIENSIQNIPNGPFNLKLSRKIIYNVGE